MYICKYTFVDLPATTTIGTTASGTMDKNKNMGISVSELRFLLFTMFYQVLGTFRRFSQTSKTDFYD